MTLTVNILIEAIIVVAAITLIFRLWLWFKKPISEYLEFFFDILTYFGNMVRGALRTLISLPGFWFIVGIISLVMGIAGVLHTTGNLITVVAKLMSALRNNPHLITVFTALMYLVIGLPALLYLILKMPGDLIRSYLSLPSELNDAKNREMLKKFKGQDLKDILAIVKILKSYGLADQHHFYQVLSHPSLGVLLALLKLMQVSQFALDKDWAKKLLSHKDKEHFHDETRALALLLKKGMKAEQLAKYRAVQKEGRAFDCAQALIALNDINKSLLLSKNISALVKSGAQEHIIRGLNILHQANPRCDTQKNFDSLLEAGPLAEEKALSLIHSQGAHVVHQIPSAQASSKTSVLDMHIAGIHQKHPTKKM